jgi:hypothetical protein
MRLLVDRRYGSTVVMACDHQYGHCNAAGCGNTVLRQTGFEECSTELTRVPLTLALSTLSSRALTRVTLSLHQGSPFAVAVIRRLPPNAE